MEEVEGIGMGGVNFTDLRYADDAVLAADKKLQKMIDKLKDTCKRVWHGYQCEKRPKLW